MRLSKEPCPHTQEACALWGLGGGLHMASRPGVRSRGEPLGRQQWEAF